jgi:hypothetical protein
MPTEWLLLSTAVLQLQLQLQLQLAILEADARETISARNDAPNRFGDATYFGAAES